MEGAKGEEIPAWIASLKSPGGVTGGGRQAKARRQLGWALSVFLIIVNFGRAQPLCGKKGRRRREENSGRNSFGGGGHKKGEEGRNGELSRERRGENKEEEEEASGGVFSIRKEGGGP